MMHRACFASLACLVLLLALRGVTAAQTVAIAGEAPPKIRRSELRVGMLIGQSDVADVDDRGFGLHLSAGRRFGDLTLSAELDHLTVGDDEHTWDPDYQPRVGRQTRFGGALRYSLLTLASERMPIAVDWWLEAGGGYERTGWQGGGVLSRPDAVFGFGFDLDVTPGGRHYGPYVAVRSHLARGPRPPGEASCGGPCDQATLPSRADIGVFFHMGLHFGR